MSERRRLEWIFDLTAYISEFQFSDLNENAQNEMLSKSMIKRNLSTNFLDQSNNIRGLIRLHNRVNGATHFAIVISKESRSRNHEVGRRG